MRIATQMWIASSVPMLTSQVYKIEGVSMGINYGANKLRFPSAVRVNSRVRAGVEMTAVMPSPLGYQVATRVTIDCAGNDKPACVADMLGVVVPLPSADCPDGARKSSLERAEVHRPKEQR